MKKGLTLIEILVVLSIISIILLISFPMVKSFDKIKSEAKMSYSVNSTVEFLNGCKSFSRNQEASAIVRRSENKSKLNLYLNTKLVKSFELPNGALYSGFNPNRGYIEFDKFGYTADACTISITDDLEQVRTITIKVGTAYVSEK